MTAGRTLIVLNHLECALMQNAPATPVECALTNSLDLKSFRFRTYKKTGMGEGRHREKMKDEPLKILATNAAALHAAGGIMLATRSPRTQSLGKP